MNRLYVKLLGATTLAFLAIAQPVFADDATSITITSISSSTITTLIQLIANVFGAIGAGVIIIYGMINTFGVASAGKNATKRAQAMEALWYVFLSVFIFFGLHGLGGVIRWIAENAFKAGA